MLVKEAPGDIRSHDFSKHGKTYRQYSKPYTEEAINNRTLPSQNSQKYQYNAYTICEFFIRLYSNAVMDIDLAI